MCLFRYRGNFQVITDVHPVHIFFWDGVRTVEVSQQACWLRAHKTKQKGLTLKQGASAARENHWLTFWYFACITLFVAYQYSFKQVHGNRVFCRPKSHQVTTQLPEEEKNSSS